MSYRDKFYSRYISTHAGHLYSRQTLEGIRKQFVVWRKYFNWFLPSDKNARIVDLGCGNGAFIFWLQESGYKNAEGIDVGKEQVMQANELGISNISRADIKEFLGGKRDIYDTVFMRDVLEHLTKEEIIEVLEVIRVSLKKNGVIVVQTSNAESYLGSRVRYADFTHEISFTESSIRQVFLVCGFGDISVFPMPPVAHGIISLARAVLWNFIEWNYKLQLLIETGSARAILTQNLIASAKKL